MIVIFRKCLLHSGLILAVALCICGCGPSPISEDESARAVQQTINGNRELAAMDEFCTESVKVVGQLVAVKELLHGEKGPLITYRIRSDASKESAFDRFGRHLEELNWERSGNADLPLTSVVNYTNKKYAITLNYGYFGQDSNFAIDCRLLKPD